MKTGVYGYQEVQDMAAIDVVKIMREDAHEASYERHRLGGIKFANAAMTDSEKAQSLVANLIEVSRSILRTGLTFEDHKRLAAIMEKIK